MSKHYYAVQLDGGSNIVYCQSPDEVFDLLKKRKTIFVLRYNDVKTGSDYARNATLQNLSAAEQAQRPVCIKTTLSDEGTFVPSEEFWIENYMFDEFYNPDRTPYVEKMIELDSECCY